MLSFDTKRHHFFDISTVSIDRHLETGKHLYLNPYIWKIAYIIMINVTNIDEDKLIVFWAIEENPGLNRVNPIQYGGGGHYGPLTVFL